MQQVNLATQIHQPAGISHESNYQARCAFFHAEHARRDECRKKTKSVAHIHSPFTSHPITGAGHNVETRRSGCNLSRSSTIDRRSLASASKSFTGHHDFVQNHPVRWENRPRLHSFPSTLVELSHHHGQLRSSIHHDGSVPPGASPTSLQTSQIPYELLRESEGQFDTPLPYSR